MKPPFEMYIPMGFRNRETYKDFDERARWYFREDVAGTRLFIAKKVAASMEEDTIVTVVP